VGETEAGGDDAALSVGRLDPPSEGLAVGVVADERSGVAEHPVTIIATKAAESQGDLTAP
jgi:hypothetical protein